jgi:hypothetical protein
MLEEQATKAFRWPRVHPQTVTLGLLFVGLLVSFGSNIRQDRHIDSLAMDLATLQQESQRQIGELRKTQSAALEQDLVRLDQLTTQLQKANEDDRQQGAATASRMRSELARTVEQRHQEMITAIADLRADLRSATRSQVSQIHTAEKPQVEAPKMSQPAGAPGVNGVEHSAPVPAASASDDRPSEDQQSPQSGAGKRRFWSKLNPFNRNKNKQESATGDPAQ